MPPEPETARPGHVRTQPLEETVMSLPRRIAVLAGALAAVALALVGAGSAYAEPCQSYWAEFTPALYLHSGHSVSSTRVGVLYDTQNFRVNSTWDKGAWVNVTDLNTHVRGWGSGKYLSVIHDCLD